LIATQPGTTLEGLRGSSKRRNKEAAIRALFLAAGVSAILVNVLILLSLLDGTVDFLAKLGRGPGYGALWNDTGWFPRRGLFDLKTIVMGTVVISAIAMLVATPLGLAAAIYLSEYARPRARRVLKPIIEMLAGIPSVVMAYFCISFISPGVVQQIFAEAGIFSMLSAGIGVGILVTPVVAAVAEDALHAVPLALREASFGLGARRPSTSLRVVFPAAISGIVAALILGLSRAVGETLVVTIAAGATGGSAFTINPLERGQTMTAAMATLATGSDQVRGASTAFPSLFLVGAVLFFLTLGLNVLSERFVRRVRGRY
jgi:phosphate transport system permease protein